MREILSGSILDRITGGDDYATEQAAINAYQQANVNNPLNPQSGLTNVHYVGSWNGSSFPAISDPGADGGNGEMIGQLATDPNVQAMIDYYGGQAYEETFVYQPDPSQIGGGVIVQGYTSYAGVLENEGVIGDGSGGNGDPLGSITIPGYDNLYPIGDPNSSPTDPGK